MDGAVPFRFAFFYLGGWGFVFGWMIFWKDKMRQLPLFKFKFKCQAQVQICLDETPSVKRCKVLGESRKYFLIRKITCTLYLATNYLFQAEKLVPQPQVSLAFGLLKMNPRFWRPFKKSISIPARYIACALLIRICNPSKSNN